MSDIRTKKQSLSGTMSWVVFGGLQGFLHPSLVIAFERGREGVYCIYCMKRSLRVDHRKNVTASVFVRGEG